MSWKLNAIIIKEELKVDREDLPDIIGLPDYSYVTTIKLSACLDHRVNNTLAIGFYNGRTIVTHGLIPLALIDPEMLEQFKDYRDTLLENFPSQEIMALHLRNRAKSYGFAYFEDGKCLRVKYGFNEGIVVDEGAVLREETKLLSASYINEKKERIFQLEEKELTESQIGDSLVFNASERIFGVPFTEIDPKEIEMYLFEYEDPGQSAPADFSEDHHEIGVASSTNKELKHTSSTTAKIPWKMIIYISLMIFILLSLFICN